MRVSRLRRDDRGTSLIELIVVLALLGLVGTLVVGTSTRALDAVRSGTARDRDTQTVRVALDAMGRTLRTAVPVDPDGPAAPDGTGTAPPRMVEAGRPDEILFYANVANQDAPTASEPRPADRPPALVRYVVTDGTLREEVTPGTWDSAGLPTWPATSTRRRTLATGVLPDPAAPAAPVFRYLSPRDLVPDAVTGLRSSSLLDAAGLLLPAHERDKGDLMADGSPRPQDDPLAAVEIRLAVHADPGLGGRPVALTTLVTLVNPEKPK